MNMGTWVDARHVHGLNGYMGTWVESASAGREIVVYVRGLFLPSCALCAHAHIKYHVSSISIPIFHAYTPTALIHLHTSWPPCVGFNTPSYLMAPLRGVARLHGVLCGRGWSGGGSGFWFTAHTVKQYWSIKLYWTTSSCIYTRVGTT